MADKKKKLPRGMIHQDSVTGNLKMKPCPNCTDGKIGGKVCIACGGRGRRRQQDG